MAKSPSVIPRRSRDLPCSSSSSTNPPLATATTAAATPAIAAAAAAAEKADAATSPVAPHHTQETTPAIYHRAIFRDLRVMHAHQKQAWTRTLEQHCDAACQRMRVDGMKRGFHCLRIHRLSCAAALRLRRFQHRALYRRFRQWRSRYSSSSGPPFLLPAELVLTTALRRWSRHAAAMQGRRRLLTARVVASLRMQPQRNALRAWSAALSLGRAARRVRRALRQRAAAALSTGAVSAALVRWAGAARLRAVAVRVARAALDGLASRALGAALLRWAAWRAHGRRARGRRRTASALAAALALLRGRRACAAWAARVRRRAALRARGAEAAAAVARLRLRRAAAAWHGEAAARLALRRLLVSLVGGVAGSDGIGGAGWGLINHKRVREQLTRRLRRWHATAHALGEARRERRVHARKLRVATEAIITAHRRHHASTPHIRRHQHHHSSLRTASLVASHVASTRRRGHAP